MSRLLLQIKDLLPEGLKSSLSPLLPKEFLSKLRKDEVYIVSFPKCGRTWLKLLLTDIILNEFPNVDRHSDVSTELLYKINDQIPRIVFTHEDDPHYKSPDSLLRDKSVYKEAKVILLLRDPRDVIVSWYFEYRNRTSQAYKEKQGVLKHDTVADFINNERGGLKTIVGYYNLWLEKSEIPSSFRYVKYEDLRLNSFETLKGLIEFLSLDKLISDGSIKKAIEKNSFENVQKREKSGDIKMGVNKSDFGHQNVENENNLKARKGKVGGYRDYLDQDDINAMDDYIKTNLNSKFGYN